MNIDYIETAKATLEDLDQFANARTDPMTAADLGCKRTIACTLIAIAEAQQTLAEQSKRQATALKRIADALERMNENGVKVGIKNTVRTTT